MNWHFIQTLLLLWIIERLSILRDRFKLAIELPNKYSDGYWAIWIYKKGMHDDGYRRHKRLMHFYSYYKLKFG